MADIRTLLAKILSARYGEEVRGSIHDAIEKCYEDGKAGVVDLVARDQIAEQEIRIEELEKKSPDTSKATALDFNLEGTSESNVILHKIYGKSRQGSYNLIPYPMNVATAYKLPRTGVGVAISQNADGSINLNGTVSGSGDQHLFDNRTVSYSNVAVSGKKYALVSNRSDLTLYARFYDEDKTVVRLETHTSIGKPYVTFTAPSKFAYMCVFVHFATSTGYTTQFDNATLKCMLVEVAEDGSYPTDFVIGNGTPSPTNPVDIVSVGSGENLIPFPYYNGSSREQYGITHTVNADGSVTSKGTKTSSTVSQFYFASNVRGDKLEGGKTYTLSGCPSGGSSSTYRLRIIFYNSTTASTGAKEFSDYGSGVTFTVPTDAEYYRLMIDLYSASNTYDLTFYPILNRGSVALPYRPYGDGVAFESKGKNILKPLNGRRWHQESGSVNNGITWTVNEDMNITANGTATDTADSTFTIYLRTSDVRVKSGTYAVRGCPSGGSASGTRMTVSYYQVGSTTRDGYIQDIGSGAVGTLPSTSEEWIISAVCYVGKGKTVENLTFYPMLTEVNADGTYPTEYEPYKHSLAVSPIEPLRSIGDVRDELEFVDGQFRVIRRIGYTKISDKTIAKGTDVFTISKANFSDNYWYDTTAKSIAFLSNMLVGDTSANASMKDGSANFATSGTLNIKYSSATTVDELKVALANCDIQYLLATPIIEYLTPSQTDALLEIMSYNDRTYIEQSMSVKSLATIEYPTDRVSALAMSGYAESVATDGRFEEMKAENESTLDAIALEWRETTSYKEGAYCRHNGKIYYCMVNNVGQEPLGAGNTFWQFVRVTEELKRLNDNLVIYEKELMSGLVYKKSGNLNSLSAFNADLKDLIDVSSLDDVLSAHLPSFPIISLSARSGNGIRFGIRHTGTLIIQEISGQTISSEVTCFGQITWIA